MFISLNFPVADFRGLNPQNGGRLERPAWGSADPQAEFVRGFGKIHTRTKSSNGFVGENYYADCNNIVRYPSQYYLNPIEGSRIRILLYPVYRRFYFDGLFSGRYELGFRLNEGTLHEIARAETRVEYSASEIARQLFRLNFRVELVDGRIITVPFSRGMEALRDGWILSSTKSKEFKTFDIQSFGSNYVGVGKPFLFIRAGAETKLQKEKQARNLLDSGGLDLFICRSGVYGQNFDVSVIASENVLDQETPRERLARLFYVQIRAIIYAHSFYLGQLLSGKIAEPTSLEPAIKSLLDRLENLPPLEADEEDALTCAEMKKILKKLDVDTMRLVREIESRVKPGWLKRILRRIPGYLDRKTDIMIEAAASASVTKLLSGGP